MEVRYHLRVVYQCCGLVREQYQAKIKRHCPISVDLDPGSVEYHAVRAALHIVLAAVPCAYPGFSEALRAVTLYVG